MAQGRIVLRSLGSSRKFARLAVTAGTLGEFAQALYPLLISSADEFGRLAGDAYGVKFGIWPTSPRTEAEFDAALAAMHRVGLIMRYQVAGEQYAEIAKFEACQPGLRRDRRGKRSRFPDPEDGSGSLPETPGDSGTLPETPTEGRKEGRKEEVLDRETVLRPVPRLVHAHKACASCGRVCVPGFLHAQFRTQLGGPEDEADKKLRAWYRTILSAIPDDQPIGDDPIKFWRAHFAASFGSAAPQQRRAQVGDRFLAGEV